MPPDPHIPAQVHALHPSVLADLRTIEPSTSSSGLLIFPCEARLDDGTVDSRVYLVEAAGYMHECGVWPWEDSAKRWIPAERI